MSRFHFWMRRVVFLIILIALANIVLLLVPAVRNIVSDVKLHVLDTASISNKRNNANGDLAINERSDANTVTALTQSVPYLESLWQQVDTFIGTTDALYSSSLNIDPVLNALRTARVISTDFFVDSPTFKWKMYLEGGQKVLFKLWMTMLDIRTMPFTIGRQFNWFRDIKPVSSERLKSMVQETADGDVIVIWGCDDEEPKLYQFEGGNINGSLMYWINRTVTEVRQEIPQTASKSATSRRYHAYYIKHRRLFEDYRPGDDTYCRKFRSEGLYKSENHFRYVLDMAVFDYLVKTDSSKHTYFVGVASDQIDVFIDRGKGVCDNVMKHTDAILAPVYQCCRIRLALYDQLVRLNKSYFVFEQEFNRLSKDDLYYPVMPRDVMGAVHHRLRETLEYATFCINKVGNETFL